MILVVQFTFAPHPQFMRFVPYNFIEFAETSDAVLRSLNLINTEAWQLVLHALKSPLTTLF